MQKACEILNIHSYYACVSSIPKLPQESYVFNAVTLYFAQHIPALKNRWQSNGKRNKKNGHT